MHICQDYPNKHKYLKGTSAVPPKTLFTFTNYIRFFGKFTTYNEHLTSKQTTGVNSLISKYFTLDVVL